MTNGTQTYVGLKMGEADFINATARFLCSLGFVREIECHFGRDSDTKADVELALDPSHWPTGMPGYLSLEAKSHHSKDSPNTINKAFGQLLKEAGKNSSRRGRPEHCLGLLIPIDGALWLDEREKLVRRGSGIEYYRNGFTRIDSEVFAGFGRLVNARYVLAFSDHYQRLEVYAWDTFHAAGEPLAILVGTP